VLDSRPPVNGANPVPGSAWPWAEAETQLDDRCIELCMHACYHECMEQMTWRASADLIERVRRAAQRQRRSMNDYVTAVLDAATNPDLAGSEADRLRERLHQAGLLADQGKRRRRPSRDETDSARRRAGHGTALSELVSHDR
jgi:hypothetical protein